MRKVKCSITIFAALSMMLVASLMFTLLEYVRLYGLDAYATVKTTSGIESVCAEYQPYLWENYHLLFLDGAYGGEQFSMDYVTMELAEIIGDNLSHEKNVFTWGGMDLFQLTLEETAAESYRLATDSGGKAFLHQVAATMKESIPIEAAGILYQQIQKGQQLEDESNKIDQSVENANQMLQGESAGVTASDKGTASERTAASAERTTVSPPERSESVEEPEKDGAPEEKSILEYVVEVKRNAILGMTAGDISNLSNQKIDVSDMVEKRKCLEGNMPYTQEESWYDKILVLEYLDCYFSDYTEPISDHALNYEIEYILCGKDEDLDNLEGTINRILLLREASNIIYLVSDNEKMTEAMVLATLLAGASANEAVIKIVQAGIIAAWAYLESVLDVRTLLTGGRIALLKTKEQWTLHLTNITDIFEQTAKAKDCADGLGYQAYLKQLLFMESQRKIAYRMMDIMEKNMHRQENYVNAKMDHMIGSMNYRLTYKGTPLFYTLSILGSKKMELFSFHQKAEYSYLP